MSDQRKRLPVAPLLGIAVLGMLGIWFLVTGCGKDPVVPPPDPAKSPGPKFETWETPAAVLVLSGEQHGYIEPCGCSETQSGGLARRADLIHNVMKRGWPVAGLDLGGSLRLAKAEAGEERHTSQFVNKLQSKLKFDTQLKVLEDLRYSAVSLGFEELLFGGGGLLNYYQPRLNPDEGKIHPVLMGANVVIYDPSLGPNRSQTLQVGDVTVGVTAVVGDSVRKRLYGDAPSPDELQIKPPEEVLPGIVETLKADKTDFNVLLSHGSFAETEKLLQQFPDFAIALCQSGGEEGRDEPQTVGNTLVLQVGWKGKHVGVLAYFPDAETKFQFELVELDNEHFENDPAVEPHLLAYQKLLEHHSSPYQQVGDQKVPRDPVDFLYSGENMFRGFHEKPGSFVGAAACGQCHTKAYEKWKTSKHAQAYESLKTGRKGQYSQPISRIHDPECLSCHVTGWNPQGVFPYPSGFLPEVVANHENEADRFSLLQGQQCENCHGPGSDHAELEWKAKNDQSKVTQDELRVGRRQMVLSKAAAEKSLCQKCHDFENSPKFQFDEYWKKVEHPWRD